LSDDPSASTVQLPPVVDRGAVARLVGELRSAFAGGGAVTVDGGDVVQIGQAGLQLLLSATRTPGGTLRISRASDELSSAIDLAGLRAPLAQAGAI
jgi:ABC-type transporter Mla MlaB component